MNADAMPDPIGLNATAGELTGLLRDAVRQICATPPPAGRAAALLERAAAWPVPAAHGWRGGPRWAVAAAVAVVGVTLGVLLYRASRPGRPVNGPVAVTGGTPAGTTIPVAPSYGIVPATPSAPAPPSGSLDGAQAFGTQLSTVPAGAEPGRVALGGARGGGLLAGTSPSRSMAVSGGAGTFIVSTGGDPPIKLGEHQPWSREARVHVWDWSAGDQSRPMKASTPGALAISPDGKWVVTGDGQRIDTATGDAMKIDKFPADVPGLAFSPDGGALVAQVGSYNGPAGKDGSVMWVFDMPAGTARVRIPGQWAYTFAAAFSPDGGQLFVMDKDKTLRRWDARTGKELGHYEPAFANSIRAIAVSFDVKHVAAAGTQGDLYVWEVAGGKLLHKLSPAGQRLPDLTTLNGMNSLTFSPDGKQLAGGAILATGLWDVETGKLARLLPPHQSGSATFVRFSRDGTKVTTVTDFVGTNGPNGQDLLVYPTVREWDLARDGRAP